MDRDPAVERRRRPRRWKPIADALYRTLRFIARHVQGFYTAFAAFVSVGFAIGVGAALLFAAFGEVVLGGFTQSIDESVLRWIEARRSPLLDHLALEVTSLGNTLVLAILYASVSVVLWLTRHRYSVLLLWIAIIGSAALSTVLKGAYGRPRPSVVEWGAQVMTESFPSGHAMSAFVGYGTVAYLVGRLEPTPALRRFTWGFAALIVIGIGLSRIYLGVHYPTDVLGGFIAGLAWILIVASALTALKYFAPRHPEVETEEKDLHAEEEREAGVRE
ncbi:MAG: phosphatase PAP2 family protein [Longimicrobiales bacterium]